ncbi:MAG: hypothetical protein QOG03_186 [Actinomycetota bacterium]|jgi:FkbM family methyltransferase|nr:hypothetical protein [Actinomycetota bacterium]
MKLVARLAHYLTGRERLASRLRKVLPEKFWILGDDALTALEQWAGGQAGVRFIQIGSNDGATNDPLHRLVVERHWEGVLVEPLPPLFEQLQRTYRDRPGLSFVNAAVGADNGEATFFYVDGSRPGDPYWVPQIGSLERSHLTRHASVIPDLEQRIAEARVPVLTYAGLLADAGIDQYDLLHVDAEGVDYLILEQVDFASSAGPRAVLFEHRHMAAADEAELRRRLDAAGFTSNPGRMDTFAYR